MGKPERASIRESANQGSKPVSVTVRAERDSSVLAGPLGAAAIVSSPFRWSRANSDADRTTDAHASRAARHGESFRGSGSARLPSSRRPEVGVSGR